MSNTEKDTAQDQAHAQYESICAMVAALDCDYSRLEELRNERDGYESDRNDTDNGHLMPEWATAYPDDAKELAELEAQSNSCADEEEARQQIQEDALDVQIRSDWESVETELTPSEFSILLCTGGPAVRIRGELDRGEPSRAWIEYQDWGTPWTRFYGADQDVLVRYASCFYFGE